MTIRNRNMDPVNISPKLSNWFSGRGRASTFENLMKGFVGQYEFRELKPYASTPTNTEHDPPSESPSQGTGFETNRPRPGSLTHSRNMLTATVTIPDLTEDTDKLKARLYLVQLKTLLTHCQILQTIANKFDHESLTRRDKRSAQCYYIKMESQASCARLIAQKLQSKEHQARCEYWAGRAYGGMRNFQRAMEHIRLAMKLDVHGHGSRREETEPRGLTWEEKSDVGFLLASATRRHEMRLAKASGNAALLIAEVEAERTGRTVDDCVEWDPDSPMWCPDQGYIVHKAKRDFVDRSKSRRKGIRFRVEHTEATRKTLSEEEWWYIKHGNVPFRRTMRRKTSDKASNKTPSQTSEASTPELSSGSSAKSESESDDEKYGEEYEYEDVCSPLPGKPCPLAQELEGMDEWHENSPPASASLPPEVTEGDSEEPTPMDERKSSMEDSWTDL